MNKQNKISLKHGYTLTINEDDKVFLKVETEDDILEFDGIKGNLMDGSDFEAHFDEEDIEMTYEEVLQYSVEFLTDWGVDTETAEAIRDDLKDWFKRYAIKQPEADAWEKVLIGRVDELRKKTETHEENVHKKIAHFREWASSAEDLDIYYCAEDMGKEMTSVKETYKAVWQKYKEAERELFNYRQTMHIR